MGSASPSVLFNGNENVFWKSLRRLVVAGLFGLGLSTSVHAELPDFTELVKQNEAAVVNISTVGEQPDRRNAGVPNDPRLEEFYRFFGPPNGRGGPGNGRPANPRRSLGSGFIIEEDGYILTNHHVVDGAAEIIVRMSDRTEYEAELIGSDQRSDLALLKIEADKDLPVLKMGNYDDVEVGQWVLAIGSPFGFDYSVTAGIVSAKGRSLTTRQTGDYVPFIQTDVAINPGNSGGPLFNLEGEVIGVNSQIFTRSGGSIGLSFAIPASVVRNVVEQIQETGVVERGWLGVSIQDVDRNLAESFGLDRPQGALIAQVGRGSPAEQAGLQPGDIIISFDGESIETSAG